MGDKTWTKPQGFMYTLCHSERGTLDLWLFFLGKPWPFPCLPTRIHFPGAFRGGRHSQAPECVPWPWRGLGECRALPVLSDHSCLISLLIYAAGPRGSPDIPSWSLETALGETPPSQ